MVITGFFISYIKDVSTLSHHTDSPATMKAALLASALLALAAGPSLFHVFSNSHTLPPYIPTLPPGLDIEWVITGKEVVACVAPGEVVNFNWEGPWHNVVEMGDDVASYADCILDADQTEAVEGPWSTTLAEEGLFLFVCGVKTHCSEGLQKAEITVSSSC